MREIEIGDEYEVALSVEYKKQMDVTEVPELLSPVNRTVSGIEVIHEYADGSNSTITWNESALESLLNGSVIRKSQPQLTQEIKDWFRKNITFPGEDVIATADDSIGMTGSYELSIKTSVTAEELSAIQEEFGIIEIYGYDADHFRQHPEDESMLGFILDTNTYIG